MKTGLDISAAEAALIADHVHFKRKQEVLKKYRFFLESLSKAVREAAHKGEKDADVPYIWEEFPRELTEEIARMGYQMAVFSDDALLRVRWGS